MTIDQSRTEPRLILDIGTHKVLGLAVVPAADGIEVLAHSMRTHGSRAMRDGQVHDVPAVARTVRTVVDEIERDLALLSEQRAAETFSPWGEQPSALDRPIAPSFTEAYIAAAGRALQTARGRAEQAEARPVLITETMQRSLEWDAVADAQANLLSQLPAAEHGKGFYCIAHTRTESLIDGEPIASLVDQRGSRFSVEVLATFLPGIVVDSLQAVLHNANLTMRGLTLEPVAALEAVVPESMRHLRLMLVDIGAGTTDIAFTGGGTVQAYAMVPVGGDAVTSALAHQFLLDFNVAEQAKRAASGGETATVHNALGDSVQIGPDELWEAIETPTTNLARAVARTAESWDLDVLPDAVLLVGGGSNTPRLPALLAAELSMPPNRIAVRDRSAVGRVTGQQSLQGPDVVTALGIGLRFAMDQEAPPVRVRVNGRPVSLFQPDRCTVREAARIAGLPLSRLVGRLGQGMTVTVNGDVLVIPGRRGQTAPVRVNGQPATLDTLLQMNDDVELETPDKGDAVRLTVRQLADRWQRRRRDELGLSAPSIIWNDVRRPLPLLARRRGQAVAFSDTVLDRDEFEFRWPQTVGELLGIGASESGAASETGADAGVTADSQTAVDAVPAAGADPGSAAGPGATADPRTAADAVPAAGADPGSAAGPGATADPQTAVDAVPAAGADPGSAAGPGATADPRARATADAPATDPRSGAGVDADASIRTIAGGWSVAPDQGAVFAAAGEQAFPIVLNGKPTSVLLPADLRLNGEPAGPSARIKDGDRIQIVARTAVAVYELLSHPEIDALRRGENTFEDAEDYADDDDKFDNGADLLRRSTYRTVPRKLRLLVRGEPAGFTTLVHPGDRVDIHYV